MDEGTQQVLVVGHDGLAGGRAALQEAARLAGSLGARLVVVRAVEPVPVATAGSALPLTGATPAVPDLQASQAVTRAVEQEGRARAEADLAGLDVPWEFEALPGEPASVLEERASALGARLVVIGMPASGVGHAVQALLLGSTSRRLSHSTACPVVLVPVDSGSDQV